MLKLKDIEEMIESGEYLFRVVLRGIRDDEVKDKLIQKDYNNTEYISFYENPFDYIDYHYFLINGSNNNTIMIFSKEHLEMVGTSKVIYDDNTEKDNEFLYESQEYIYQNEWRCLTNITLDDEIYLGFCNFNIDASNTDSEGKVLIEILDV